MTTETIVEQENAHLRKLNEQLADERDSLRQQLAEAQEQHEIMLSGAYDEIKRLYAENKKHLAEITRLSVAVGQLMNERDELRQQLAEAQRLLDAANAELHELRIRAGILKAWASRAYIGLRSLYEQGYKCGPFLERAPAEVKTGQPAEDRNGRG